MDKRPSKTTFLSRLSSPGVMIAAFILVMSGSVLGLLFWKASESRRTTLARAEIELHNLSHSLAEHAAHTIKAVDVATIGMVDLLRYQQPLPERYNAFLRTTVRSMPQLREIGVMNAAGDYIYASSPETPRHNNADRDYFIFHRDNPGTEIKITGPVMSRLLNTHVIALSKRVTKLDGSFGGVLVAVIDCNFFASFYKTFRLGTQGGISLLSREGIVLSHSLTTDVGRDLSKAELFQTRLKDGPSGYYKIISPFDGVPKYFGYQQNLEYGTVSTVALPEGELLSNWRNDLMGDVIVAAALLCIVGFMGAVLSAQFARRARVEASLRNREQLYRLLADNIADVVILIDRYGNLMFVSQSVETVLGWKPDGLVGKSCFELTHPDDVQAVQDATARLMQTNEVQTLRFRTYRADGSDVWVEIVFKLASAPGERVEMVGVLRDISQRKAMEDELTALNARLTELARTDGLTGLANRRSLDGYLHREFVARSEISVLMIDIDHFKKFNDELGHQAGDECLRRVAQVIAGATHADNYLSARYGGEEFAVVLPGANEQRAFLVAESIRLKVQALKIGNPAAAHGLLSISIGAATKTDRMKTESDLIAEADMALYEAKRAGRDNVTLASSVRRTFVEAGLVPIIPGAKARERH